MLAMSAGCAKRPTVVLSTNSSTTPGTMKNAPVAFVSTRPGAIVLTRMRRTPSSIAATLVSITTPAFAAQ